MVSRDGIGAIRSIGYVIILCNDFDTMRHFYIDLFSFQIEDEKPGQSTGFRVGACSMVCGLRGAPMVGHPRWMVEHLFNSAFRFHQQMSTRPMKH